MRLMRMVPLPESVVSELAGLAGGSLEAAGRLAGEALRGWLECNRALVGGGPPAFAPAAAGANAGAPAGTLSGVKEAAR